MCKEWDKIFFTDADNELNYIYLIAKVGEENNDKYPRLTSFCCSTMIF